MPIDGRVNHNGQIIEYLTVVNSVQTGELAPGTVATHASATSRPCSAVEIVARSSNVASMYVGATSGVAAASGVASTTVGREIAPGAAAWFFVSDLNRLWYITGGTADGATYVLYPRQT